MNSENLEQEFNTTYDNYGEMLYRIAFFVFGKSWWFRRCIAGGIYQVTL
jgi:hypothetical protein